MPTAGASLRQLLAGEWGRGGWDEAAVGEGLVCWQAGRQADPHCNIIICKPPLLQRRAEDGEASPLLPAWLELGLQARAVLLLGVAQAQCCASGELPFACHAHLTC